MHVGIAGRTAAGCGRPLAVVLAHPQCHDIEHGRISAAFPEAKYAAVNIDSQQGTSKERESWAIEVQLRGVDLQNASAVALDTGHAKCEIIQSDRVPPIP